MPDDATAGLIFASDQANHNFARVLGDLRRSHLSITHRLQSICRDAAFVADVAARYPDFPVVANERCGSWYIPVSSKAGSAYFKSTDGHTGQWKFSTRRLNLHILPLLCRDSPEKGGGCILVDSTRRGKRMPDALSKTVPLWCCVLNRALFPAHVPEGRNEAEQTDAQALYTPPGVVSASEHSQMLARVPAFVDALGGLGVFRLGEETDSDPIAWRRQNLPNGKPLRPVWVTPDMPWPNVDHLRDRFNVVLCCTSSRVPPTGEDVEDGVEADYIQGAADDTENWAHGLTPDLFWANCEKLLDTPEADLPEMIAAIVKAGSESAVSKGGATFSATVITPHLSVGQWTGSSPPTAPEESSGVCQIAFVRQTTEPVTWVRSPTSLEVGLGKQDKIAGRTLRHALSQICEFVSDFLTKENGCSSIKSVRILCPTGRDISVGTALALLCYCFEESGKTRTATSRVTIVNKDVIRVRLARIMTAMPHANPSRTTLQSVNSFLID
ncbi:tRNA A64-2'-O-ribosylphosphate transferase [Sporothrix brasiliensis 5110]|uniref:tRNA A64-2'-O-ribosylphosphate transferase n=1 Tax=Sporothrix brasiliensis 5110 TaxID=1398154 RepID=A0A0C2ITQ5_9PEZI|nr:tRNA A64-2'-O-ribosylphosphate transferase [Sporothrix brasiliensis 5110]KIH88407.1 tRNA A64-2'-O-ribosylphosphate transferase [Sporothrix brasiliensis 5110]